MTTCEKLGCVPWRTGQIVRYDVGSTALARIIEKHPSVDGWYAEQFFGGTLFICDKPFSPIREASKEDLQKWKNR
jgi:hypothetical protein